MDKLSLTLLGNFEATLDERPFTQFRTNKVQGLLIYLIVEAPAVQQRESLMELLWPGLPLKSAQVNLRQILYQLNKVMPDGAQENMAEAVSLLITDRKTIQLHPHYPASSDVTTLTTLLQRSWQHNHADLLTCADCRTWLEDAVALYQGDFLADFSLYDSNSYEAWAQVKREYLRRQTLDALDTLTQIYLAEQAYQQAEQAARQQLAIDNLRENAYRQLMQILALTGRRSEAVALYEACRRLLSDELGMAPAAKTTALSEQIKGGSLSLVTPVQPGIRGYELGEKLGEGAFGSVYKAVQKGIGREVAVKIIHAKYANRPRFIRRFEAEAQMVARLEYPHIVPLYDYWREADGAYLVMRWLRGGSLQAALEKELFGVETAVTLISQIAGALHTAHRQGIIHRDVKPANILLDEDGNAYLSDFGIARDSKANLQLTQAHELLGSPNYISPEQLLGEEVTPATDIYCLGLVLYKVLTGSQPYSTTSMVELIQKQINEPLPLIGPTRPDLPATIDDIIQQATAKKAADRFDDTLQFAEALHQAVSGANGRSTTPLPPITAVAESDIINPYKGLHAFQERDADHFYGRQALIEQLLSRLTESPVSNLQSPHRFLAIVGPSGSGKSSVVKAGLIPALNKGALPGSDAWFIVEMTPGSYPLEELESALLRVAVNPPPSLLELLQKDERGLLRVLKRLLPQDRNVDNPSQLLLVIDQFEELFTLVQNEADRTHFLDNLFAALTDSQSRLRVIITLRADFYDRPLQLPQLGEWLRQRTELVLPLTVAELEQAITAPATSMGVTLESGLVSAIITNVKEQPGALPLLQYTLTELFERRNSLPPRRSGDRSLTLSTYEEIGGVTGALARRADDIYTHLDPEAQEATRQLFLRLITLGEGIEDTRRRVLQSELESISDQSEIVNRQSSIVNEYGRYRLLTFDHDPVTRGPTVEVAHEALLREWPRLREWLDESREDVRRQRLLGEATSQWATANQDSSYLLRGGRLIAFESWAETTTIALTENERAFLESSISTRNQRHAEEEARRQRQLETARKLAAEQATRAEEQTQAAQSLRQRALFLTGALVIAAILAVLAFGFSRSSANNANLAATRAAEALVNADLAATSEVEAINSANLALTREAEAEDGRETAVAAQQLALEEADFRATAEADALEQQAIAEQQEALAQVQLRVATSRELALAALANLESNPELSLILSLEALNNTYTVEAEEALRTALQESRLEKVLTTIDNPVESVDYHPSGAWIAGVRKDGTLIIWDAETGTTLQTIPLDITITEEPFANILDISPDGTRMAVAGRESILILETDTFAITHRLEGHANDIVSIEFSPDSTSLASGDVNGILILWQTSTGAELFTGIASSNGWVNDVSFSHDGSKLATAGDDVTARIWDVATGSELVTLTYDASFMNSVLFTTDDGQLYSAPVGIGIGFVLVWDVEAVVNGGATEPVAVWVDLYDGVLRDMKLTYDGRYLFTTGQGTNAMIWDLSGDNPEHALTLAGHNGDVQNSSISPDNQQAVTISGGVVRLWDISAAGLGEVKNIADFSAPMDYRPEINRLVTMEFAGAVKIWDTSSGELLSAFDTHVQNRRWVIASAVNPNGQQIVKGSNDGSLSIWDLTTQQEVATWVGHGPGVVGGFFPGVIGVDYSPDGTLLATAGADGYVIVWDLQTLEKVYEWRVDPRPSDWTDDLANGATQAKFSPDGKTVAAATDAGPDGSGMIKVWDLATGEERVLIENVEGRFWGLEFSRDGQSIAGLVGGNIIILDVDSGERIAFLLADGAVMDFSADGKQIISGTFIYDIKSEEALFRLPRSGSLMVMSNDGQYLATNGDNGIHFYTLKFEELVSIAQARVTRALTTEECQQYLHMDSCPAE